MKTKNLLFGMLTVLFFIILVIYEVGFLRLALFAFMYNQMAELLKIKKGGLIHPFTSHFEDQHCRVPGVFRSPLFPSRIFFELFRRHFCKAL